MFCLMAKRTRLIGGNSALVTAATFFTLLAAFWAMPSIATAFSLQLVALPFFPSPLTSPPGPYQSQSALAKGKFLVASRLLGDPNFAETVVLLIEFGQSGTMGVIINRPTEAPLSTLLPEVKGLQQRTDPVFL